MGAEKKKKEVICCPYCDAEIAEAAFPFCQACKVTILYCPACRQPVPKGKEVCPSCGADIQKKSTKGGK
jgi:predicted amidophosphoribosyltransferase